MNKKVAILLALSFAVLMSLPWLVPHAGAFALVGFVPLLLLDYIADGKGDKRIFLWYYGAFVLWNAFTTFWVCNATVGGGIFAILANAAQMALVWALFRLSKRKFSGVLPYVFLAVMWIAWERQYFHCQISWPWLTLGNAFAQSTSMVQWYELTGSLGGSLWVWAANLGIFGLVISLASGKWNNLRPLGRWSASLGLLLVLVGPIAASEIRYCTYKAPCEGKQKVLIGQPNFDPYHKFESMSQHEQNSVLLGLYGAVLDNGTASSDGELLLIAPETFTSDVWMNDPLDSPTVGEFRSFLSDNPGTEILFGAGAWERFDQNSAPSILARPMGEHCWYESYNSAILLDSAGLFRHYHKSKLVVGTELTPYPKLFVPLDDRLGGVMGRCIGQDHADVLTLNSGVKVGCAVCYESVYGEYCTEYVRRGADFLSVITNDAWWGNTPGYRQHLNYSRLRAIETRRDIARCGNTGISALIDSRGDIIKSTAWWQEATLCGEVSLRGVLTPFVRYGDIVGKACTLAFLLLAAFLLVCLLKR